MALLRGLKLFKCSLQHLFVTKNFLLKPFFSKYFVDELPLSGINEGPSQKEIDFNKQMIGQELLNEYRMIHDESEKINEHGIGIR